MNKLDIEELFETVVVRVGETFGYAGVVIDFVRDGRIWRGPSSGPAVARLQGSVAINQSPAATQCIATGQPVQILDLAKNPQYRTSIEGVGCGLCLPVRDKGDVFCLLGIITSANRINEHDLRIMTQVADQISLALENARLHERTRNDLARTGALYNISRAVHSGHDLESLMGEIIRSAREALSAHCVTAYKIDFVKECIEHVSVTDNDGSTLRPMNFEWLQKGLSGWTLRHLKSVLVEKGVSDPREDPQFAQLRAAAGIGSIIYAPLVCHGCPMGLIVAVNRRDESNFDNDDVELLMAMASQSAMALEQRQLHQRIERQAFNDALTGLPNRLRFEHRVNKALERARMRATRFAILFIDLDGFKHINDSLGHHVGDALLIEVARKLRQRTRETDTLARMGGDEFALLLSDLSSAADAEQIAEEYLALFQGGFSTSDQQLFVGASIGISFYPNDGSDASSLLRHADTAMYAAKSKGKNNVQCFTAELAKQAKQRLEIENDLRKALDDGQFSLYYQPQVDIIDCSIVGFEALLRWWHPIKGLVLPDTFIPIAEDSRLILTIGNWVLRTACEQNARWQKAGYPPVKVTVNISALQFERIDFQAIVHRALNDSGLAPRFLELEVTESVVMHDVDLVVSRLRSLRELGVSIAVDDFGTGYSSLQYLQKLPLDSLKIDRSFMQDIDLDEPDRRGQLVNTIVLMAQSFNLNTIAEGVETQSQIDFLRLIGCNQAQGYYFSPPVAHDTAEVLLSQCPPTHWSRID